MKHMDQEEALIEGLLRKTRTIAIIGASPRPVRHSGQVVSYLHKVGYDVIPVRPDRIPVAELPTFRKLGDIAGPVDLVVIFRRPDAVPTHIREAAAKGAKGVWLPPGTWSRAAGEEAQKQPPGNRERSLPHGRASARGGCLGRAWRWASEKAKRSRWPSIARSRPADCPHERLCGRWRRRATGRRWHTLGAG
jgi:uncharacterized protein